MPSPWFLYGCLIGAIVYTVYLLLKRRYERRKRHEAEVKLFMKSLMTPQSEESKVRGKQAIEFLKKVRESSKANRDDTNEREE